MTPRSTPLLGFKPPFVKDGEIVLPVLTGSGDWAELRATPATWQRIGIALALQMTPAKETPKPTDAPRTVGVAVDETRPHTAAPKPAHAFLPAPAPIRKPSGRIL